MLAGRGDGYKPLRRGLREGEGLVVETAQGLQAGVRAFPAPVARTSVARAGRRGERADEWTDRAGREARRPGTS